MIIYEGVCATTNTERYQNTDCRCPTYPNNLGPCLNHEQGSNGRCVYCDHELTCQPKDMEVPTVHLHRCCYRMLGGCGERCPDMFTCRMDPCSESSHVHGFCNKHEKLAQDLARIISQPSYTGSLE